MAEESKVVIGVGVTGAGAAATELGNVDKELNLVGKSATRSGAAFGNLSKFLSTSHIQRIRDIFRDTGLAVNSASAQVENLASRMQALSRENAFRQLQRDANLTNVELARLRASVGDYSGAMSSLGRASLAAKAAIAAVGVSAVAFGKSCLEAQIQMQRLSQSYGAVFGAGAQEQLKAVYEQADRVGLKFTETAQAAKGFFAAGQGTTLEKDLQKIFRSVTDAGAALQLSGDEVNGALVALGQMMSKGKVQAEELRGQLGERLPGAFQLAAKAMGMTTAELDKFMADGKLTAEDLLPKLAAAIEEKYGAAAENAANTVSGSINRMATEWERFRASVIEAGPVVFAVKFVTENLKARNDALDAGRENEAMDKELARRGVIPQGKTRNPLSDTAEYIPAYTDAQREPLRIEKRQDAYLEQYAENEARSLDASVAKARAAITESLKKTKDYKVKGLKDEMSQALKDIDAGIRAAKAQGSGDDVIKGLEAERAKAQAAWQARIKAEQDKGGKSAEAAARKAAVAQADYAGEVERTGEKIKSLRQQLELDPTDNLTAKKIRAEEKYRTAISRTREELSKQVSRGQMSQAEAERLRTLKEEEASLQKQADLREAEQQAARKDAQVAQGQVKFYKELGQLSGGYINDLDLQKTLIAAQAKEYRETYKIADDLVDEWERLQLLQASTDPFDGAYRGLLKFNAEYSNSAAQWESLSYDFAKNFTSTTRSMFDEFLDTGKVSFDRLGDLFVQLLKDMAWQAIAQPIVLSVVQGVSGALGTQGLVAGGLNTLTGGTAQGGMGTGTGSIFDLGVQAGQQYATSKLFGGNGGMLGGIADTINSTMASWFPSSFASSNVLATSNIATNSFFQAGGAASSLPTQTFTGAVAPAGIGGAIGSIASPYFNDLIGVQNNTGSQIGSTVGALAGVGGALALNAWNPIGWGGAAIAALGALAGGSIGGLLGFQQQKKPKLNMSMMANLWEPVGGEAQHSIADGKWSVLTDENLAYQVSSYAKNNAQGQMETAGVMANVARGFAESSWNVANGLAELDESLKAGYLSSLKEQGPVFWQAQHEGKAITTENIQGSLNLFAAGINYHMLNALGSLDLAPLTKAADGFAADTAEEVSEAIGKIAKFISIGQMYENEEFNDFADIFYENAVDQVTRALDNISLEPFAAPADRIAGGTVGKLASALESAFSVYDIGESIANEEMKTTFQTWAEQEILNAFKGLDLSYLRVDFDQTTFAGLQQAYAAVQAWQAVEKGINDVINPASELETTLGQASLQFDDWIDKLRALGWQEEAIMQLESRRADYLYQYRKELASATEQDLSLRISSLQYGSDSLQYAMHSLKFNQANELDEAASKFGKDSDLYRTTELTQRAEYTRTLIDQLKAMRESLLQKEQEAAQKRIQDEQDALNERISAINKEVTEARRLADTFSRLARDLESYRRDLWTSDKNLTGSRYQDAYAQFDQLYEKAMTGDEEAYKDLRSKAGELLSLGREQLPERGEYNDLFYDVDQKLKKAQEAAQKQADEAERQALTLLAQLEAINAQNEALNAQLEALNKQTEQGEQTLLSLDQIEAAIASLEGVLKGQVEAASSSRAEYAMTGGWDWNRLLAEKAAAMNEGRTLMPGQSAGGWTADKVFQEIRRLGLSGTEEWYNLYGQYEGFTLKAAATTNAQIDSSINSLDSNLRYYLGDNAKYLDSTLKSQLEQAYAQGVDVNGILATEAANWPQALSKMDGLGSAFSSSISALSSSISGALSSAMSAMRSSYSQAASSGSTAKGSSPSGKYDSEYALLANKAAAMNAGRTLMPGQTAGGWTAASVKAEIQKYGMTTAQWYAKYGKAEGFAQGGITPANRIYMVGENGPELMMSPRQWGVLNNEATDALLNPDNPPLPVAQPAGLDAQALAAIGRGLAELAGYMRQVVVKTDKTAWACEKIMNIQRMWDAERLPGGTA